MNKFTSTVRSLRFLVELIFFGGIFCLIAARVLGSGISHDEYQFIASGQFFGDQGLLPYLDFPFHHMPYQLVVNGLAAALTDYDFLAVRAVSGLFTALTAIVLYRMLRRILNESSPSLQILAGGLGVLAFLFDPTLTFVDGRAFNHTLACLFSLLAWQAFQSGLGSPARLRFLGLAGLLAGLAAGVRLSYAVVILVFYAALLAKRFTGNRPDRARSLLFLTAGFVLSMLPVGLLILAAPQQFFYGNIIYINLNRLYREYLGHRAEMDLLSKGGYFLLDVLTNPSTAFLYVGGLAFAAQALVGWLRSRVFDLFAWTLSALILALFVTAFAPTPLWLQYFLAPLPFLILAVAEFLKRLARPRLALLGTGILAVYLLAQAAFFTDLSILNMLSQPDRWIPLQVHRYSTALRTYVPDGKILSLVPMLPLEGGLDSYEMFAVGPFSWRTVNFLTPERRAKYEVIAPVDLEAFLANDPPSAILVGFETLHEGLTPNDPGGLEQPFIAYAIAHGYSPIKLYAPFIAQETILWVKYTKGDW